MYLHWSWFLIAFYGISRRASEYSSLVWNVAEYLALFLIVLMHEFGHSLACRQVGGRADQIILWPLGGVAYVAPPHRPGATLWSIAAGPLVNVVLFPILSAAILLSRQFALGELMPNLNTLIFMLWLINFVLLCFNLLPIYPLDGGQILRSLLWFLVGPARSLMIAATIGMAGVVVLIALALWGHNPWLVVIGVFILLSCGRGLLQARTMARMEAALPNAEYACPVCRAPPPKGEFWICGQCRKPFDLFQAQGVCSKCGSAYAGCPCRECGALRTLAEWKLAASTSESRSSGY